MSLTLSDAAKLHDHVPPDWYESSVKTNLLQRYWHRRRFQAVGQVSEKVTGEILDIGSADGFFTREILRFTGCSRIIGIDVLKSSVAYAKKRYAFDKRMRFMVADGKKLPFLARKFAAVYCLEAMEHVDEPEKVLKEIKRVLKPGGYTVLLVPAENLLFKIVWFFWTKWRGRIWQDTHLQKFSGGKLETLLSKTGFVRIQSRTFLLGMLLLVKAVKIR